MSTTSLQGKVAIVTGASRGIGYTVALELAKRGAHVIATYTSDSSAPKIDQLTDEIKAHSNGSTLTGVKVDLRSLSAPAEIIQATKSAYPDEPISILVNNAGCELAKPLAEIKPEDVAFVYDLNVRAPMFLLQAILPHLPASGARIVNVASVGARKGFPGLSLYCSSKAALEALTRCWSAELGANGHTVNCVNPGPTETDMVANIDKGIVDNQKRTTPVENRLGTTDDVAQVVAWLCEEGSRWVSGQCVSASGGLEMY